MKENKYKTGVLAGVLLPMGLTCLFAFCSLALALLGGRAYKQIQNGIDDSYGSTVAASYLRTKLLQNNTAGAVSLRDEEGYQLLVITSRTEDRVYEIRIYVDGGTLRESFVTADTPFDPMAGVAIAEVKQCDFALEGDTFTAFIESPEGSKLRTAFTLLEGGAAP